MRELIRRFFTHCPAQSAAGQETNPFQFPSLAFCALFCISTVAGCFTNPVTGRKELNLVSSGEEMQLGLTSFEQMKHDTPISYDARMNATLQRVGKRLASIASRDMPNAQWEFVLFQSSEANAFCLPGGKVGVYTGLLPMTKDDAGLATVMGHEIAHAVSRHGVERMSEAKALQWSQELAGEASISTKPATKETIAAAFGIGGPLLVQLPHSRKHESEADHIGLIYMARAGYDPRSALDFWRRFAEYDKAHGGQNTPTFLRTHPLDETRIQQLENWLPEAQRQYSPANP
jgi:predicted Zn-dependent protease